MGEIFRDASRVVVWLGPEKKSSALAFESLQDLGSHLEVDWTLLHVSSSSRDEFDWASVVNKLIKNKGVVDAIVELLIAPWFDRLWIWQEIRLAKENALVLCGHWAIPWQAMRKAIYAIGHYNHPELHTDFYRLLCKPLQIGWYKESTLAELLNTTRGYQCSDPRDRIFALKSLLGYHENKAIVPEYTRSVKQVYTDLVVRSAFELGDLNILRFCEPHDHLSNLPSWVPDWSQMTAEENRNFSNSDACGLSKCEVEFIGETILEAAGTCNATIVQVERPIPFQATDCNFLRSIKKLASKLTLDEPYINGETMLDTLCRTFYLNLFSNSYMPSREGLAHFDHAKEALLEILPQLNGGSTTVSQSTRFRLEMLKDMLGGWSFFTTREGYLGLTPVIPNVGDQVMIILGCRSPLLLHPQGSEYQVVGFCFVLGLIDCEGLLGPLPENWRRISRLHEVSEKWFDAYVNAQTGAVTIEDPRLGPLPAGWRIRSHDQEHLWQWYVNDETGENSACFDPRMTSRQLKLRGVDIKTFRLV